MAVRTWKVSALRFLIAAILIIAGGCGGGGGGSAPDTLNPQALNLVFVRSADIDRATGGLSVRGLNRALAMGSFLEDILAGEPASGIHALEPATHPISSNAIPDLSPLETIEQFALLYQNSLGYGDDVSSIAVDLTFTNEGANLELIDAIVKNNRTGNFFFAVPVEMLRRLMGDVGDAEGLNLDLPPTPADAYNHVYVISIPSEGAARVEVFDAGIRPSDSYPDLHLQGGGPCEQAPFTFSTAGNSAYKVPAGVNRGEILYFVRHAEAHPVSGFDNGNYVCQGQWRAIGQPSILLQKIGGAPDLIYSSDPAELVSGSLGGEYSYVRPSLTVNPVAIQTGMSLNIAAENGQSVPWYDAPAGVSFFFFGGRFSGKSLLVGWEHEHIQSMLEGLIGQYGPLPPGMPSWSGDDYSTIYRIQLDASGNLSFSNSCSGITTASLPANCPAFSARQDVRSRTGISSAPRRTSPDPG
jgi:hypothetical protein